jgi:carbamoyl-phosphate synthase large subunit
MSANERALNVLILGLGGNVSQGILKALRMGSLDCHVVGACITPAAAGLYATDYAVLSPPAADPSFVEWLTGTCQSHSVDAVLSGVEPVLEVLAEHRETIEGTGARSIVSPPEMLAIGGDKLLTANWLQQQGLRYPLSAAAEDGGEMRRMVDRCGYPLLAKPRRGKGSDGIITVSDERGLDYVCGLADYVVQEYLGSAEEEYSCGCFSDAEGKVRGCIVMRRRLSGGTTSQVRVGEFADVREEAIAIATALGPAGPCNVQLRQTDRGPVCFEINVRFSGTTPLRAHFGFNEVEAALRQMVLGEPPRDMPLVTGGTAVRYWSEVYIDPAGPGRLAAEGELDSPGGYAEFFDMARS